MDTNILNGFLRALTGAWYLDIQFLANTVLEHELDIEDVIESVEMNFWKEFKCDFNYIVYETLSTIASKFIDENRELFDKYSDEYEIYTNYMDSHIRFVDETVQSKFEQYY